MPFRDDLTSPGVLPFHFVIRKRKKLLRPTGFEPRSSSPKAVLLTRRATEVCLHDRGSVLLKQKVGQVILRCAKGGSEKRASRNFLTQFQIRNLPPYNHPNSFRNGLQGLF